MYLPAVGPITPITMAAKTATLGVVSAFSTPTAAYQGKEKAVGAKVANEHREDKKERKEERREDGKDRRR
jgi:hypothetical protein